MLMKLLGFVRTYLMPVSVLVVLAILALTMGPRVGLKPPRNIVVFAALMVLAILICLVIWYVQRKRERQFETAIVQQAQQDMSRASVARRAEMEALIARWKESIRLLREANLRGKNVLQKLPWFAVIGESGSGKTTLIKNSGLDFPIGDAKIRGIGGTKNCDWWFANEAIILDTAGRYAFEVQSAPDREEWERFLGLLKKTRKRCPISGLVVTVPADSLLRKTEDEVSAYAQHLRGKINDLMTRLEIVFPVYLVLTKVDLVEGFVGFFSRYPANRVREAVGRTFADVRPASCVATAGKTLDDLYDRLCSMSLGLMEEEDPGAPAQPYLMHPEEYHTLAGRLKVFIESLFRENIYMRNPIFRGLYLTSGTQEGRTITSAFSAAAAGLGIAPDVMTTTFAAETPKRAYFVRDLLSRILVEDAKRELVRALSLGGKQQFVRALYRVILPAGAIALVLLIWAAGSWAGSRADWRQLASAVKDSRFMSPSSVPGREAREALLDLSKIYDLHASAAARSGALNLGLVRSDPEYAASVKAFNGAAEKHVLQPVLARLKQDLEGGQTARREFFEELAAYVAYRRALMDPSSVEISRLEGLADTSSTRGSLGLQNVRPQLAGVAHAYASFGGKYSGGLSFSVVAQRIQQFVADVNRSDPLLQVRGIASEGAMTVRANQDAQAISSLWERLRSVARGAGAGGDISPGVLQRLDREMESIPDAKGAALDALRVLEQLAGGPAPASQPEQAGGKVAAFVSLVRTPLGQASEVPLPQCAPVSGDPATVTAVLGEMQKFASEVKKNADAVGQGILSLDAQLSQAEKIDGQVTADLVRRGRMAEAYTTCTAGWFDPEGPLTRKALSGGGGGPASGGGGDALPIGPSGLGLFRCSLPVPSASGGGGAPDPQLAAKLQAFSVELQKVWQLPDVPRDLIEAQRGTWERIGGAVAGGGGGGGGAEWRKALSRIDLDTPPESWQLEDIPSLISGDGNTLKNIVSQIKNGLVASGQPASDLEAFNPDSYMNALKEIAEALKTALSSPQKAADLARLRQNRALFDRVFTATNRAPAGLASLLKKVPTSIQEKLGDGPGHGEFYESELKPKLKEAASRFPFNASSDTDLAPADFDDLFGKQGKLATLKEVVPSPSGEMKRLLAAAAQVQEAYGDMAFTIRVTPEAPTPAVEIEPGVDKERLQLTFKSWGITLADTLVPPGGGKVPIRLQDGSASKLEPIQFDVGERGKHFLGIGAKKVYEKDELKLGELPPPASGPWSFLRLLRSGNPEQKGSGVFRCSWRIPLQDKKGKKIATIVIAYEVNTRLLEKGFFSGFAPPARVEE